MAGRLPLARARLVRAGRAARAVAVHDGGAVSRRRLEWILRTNAEARQRRAAARFRSAAVHAARTPAHEHAGEVDARLRARAHLDASRRARLARCGCLEPGWRAAVSVRPRVAGRSGNRARLFDPVSVRAVQAAVPPRTQYGDAGAGPAVRVVLGPTAAVAPPRLRGRAGRFRVRRDVLRADACGHGSPLPGPDRLRGVAR